LRNSRAANGYKGSSAANRALLLDSSLLGTPASSRSILRLAEARSFMERSRRCSDNSPARSKSPYTVLEGADVVLTLAQPIRNKGSTSNSKSGRKRMAEILGRLAMMIATGLPRIAGPKNPFAA
jgi:hypothetical protein